MAVPVRAGHRFGDLGQAPEVSSTPGEAFFQDHDALEFAPPFAHKERAGLQRDPIAGLGIAPIERSRSLTALPFRLVSQQSAHSLIEIAESGDLQTVTQHLHEQPPRQMGGRFAAEMVAPLSAKAFEFETFQAGKDCLQGSVNGERNIRRRTRRMLSQSRLSAFRAHPRHAAAFAFTSR
jgi:hypothetical protein